jgi:hypothetical protein
MKEKQRSAGTIRISNTLRDEVAVFAQNCNPRSAVKYVVEAAIREYLNKAKDLGLVGSLTPRRASPSAEPKKKKIAQPVTI